MEKLGEKLKIPGSRGQRFFVLALAGTLLFVISLFFPRSLFGMALASFCLLAVILLSQVPLRLILKGVKPPI